MTISVNNRVRVFCAILLAFFLSGATLADICFKGIADEEYEIGLLDEESAESEINEEIESDNKKTEKFGSDFIDSGLPISQLYCNIVPKFIGTQIKSPLEKSLKASRYIPSAFYILFHSLIFYDSNF